MQPLEVVLFGGFQLRCGDDDVPPLPSRAARSLLAYLATHRGVRHPRDHLVDRFWPELPPNRGRRRLSHTLWQVQDALSELRGEVDHLDVSADAIGFDPAVPCWVDVEEFTRGLDRARERRSTADARVRDLTDLEATVGLYRGEFLTGHDDPWIITERERLHQRYLEALGWLVGLAKAHAAYDDALVYARRLTNEDPLREDGHREVMRLSMLLGRTSDAIRQFERVQEVLAEELGAEPSAETVELHDRIVRRRRLSPPAAAPTPLPERVPLIGRERERDRALTVLERAIGGRGGAVLVEGEPGVGTSRLLAEVVDDAGWRAFTTVTADCPSPDTAIAYGVIQDLLDDALTPLRVEQLRPRVGPVWLAEAARLAPALAAGHTITGHTRPAELASSDGARRMRDALIRILAALAEVDPLLLVIDDAQWADLESLDVLSGLAEVVDDHRIVVVVGYRGDEARQRADIWEALRGIDRAMRPERLLLRPLDAFSTGELIRVLGRGHGVAGAAVTRLHRETGGNPRFLVETLRSLSEEQRLEALAEDDPRLPLPVPGSIRDLLLERLERLAPEPRTVLDLAAVAAAPVSLELLADAGELPRTSLVDAVDRLVRGSELVPHGDAFVVHHEQLRRVAVEALDPASLTAAHRRLGDALHRIDPGASERLARHYVHAQMPQVAVGHLRQAARSAIDVHAYATAAAHLRLAREQLDLTPASVATRVEVLSELESVLDVLGERDAQRELLDELAVLADGVATREVEVARRRALLSGHLGDLEIGRAAADQAVAVAEQLAQPDALAGALVACASVSAWSGQLREAISTLERAAATAASPAVALSARAQLGSVLREAQRYRDAERVLEQVLVAAGADDAIREEIVALGGLGTVRMETGAAGDAIELYTRAIDRSVAVGFRRAEAIHRANRANANYVSGHIAAALDDNAQAAELFERLGDERGAAAVRLNRGTLLHTILGADDAAQRELVRASAVFEGPQDATFLPMCIDAQAAIELRAGQLARARELLSRAWTVAAADDAWTRVQLASRQAQLELAEGHPDRALAGLRPALDEADRHGLADLHTWLLGLTGQVLVACGDPTAALKHTMQAVQALDAGVERGYLVRHQHACALAAAGRHTEAQVVAETAAAELRAVLDELSADDRVGAEAVPEHRAVLAGVATPTASVTARRLTVAAADAPLGRPLRGTELIEVVVDPVAVPDDPADPVARRRAVLARIADEVERQGGAPTVSDLAAALEVSPATVRRDLAALRSASREVRTRGSRAG